MPGPATPSSSESRSRSRLELITWDDASPTGGNAYNAALVTALQDLGVDARLVRVGSGWPDGTPSDRRRLINALVAARARRTACLVDGIVAGNAADELAAAAGEPPVSVLVHLPLAEERGLPPSRAAAYRAGERAALSRAGTVICPSRFAATLLAQDYQRPDAVVAPPGVQPGRVATGSRPPQLLSLGAITPTKNPLATVEALRELADLDWTARLVGSTRPDPRYAAQVRVLVDQLGPRVTLTGALTGPALEAIWAATDLLVLSSEVETYGLVVAEALAHGVPAVVPAGTGAVEALGDVGGRPPGAAVDPTNLAAVLRRWLTDPALRSDWRALALRRRTTQPTWADTASVVRAALGL